MKFLLSNKNVYNIHVHVLLFLTCVWLKIQKSDCHIFDLDDQNLENAKSAYGLPLVQSSIPKHNWPYVSSISNNKRANVVEYWQQITDYVKDKDQRVIQKDVVILNEFPFTLGDVVSEDWKDEWQLGRQRPDAGFSWNDCGSGGDPGHIQSLQIGPTPLHFPGNISVAVEFTLNTTEAAPLSAVIEVKKKIAFVYIKVKTFQYNDICALLEKKSCPKQFQHCHCPYQQGHYKLPLTTVVAKSISIPGGEYHIRVWLHHNNIEVGCLYLDLNFS